jgi:hypothetical protein
MSQPLATVSKICENKNLMQVMMMMMTTIFAGIFKLPNGSRNLGDVKTISPQGCQMVYFQTKNPNLGKFRRALEWKRLGHSMTIWNILQSLGTFYGHLVIYVVTIWYILPRFGILCLENFGNPAL